MFRCGQCRHFEKAKNNLKDLCGAWNNLRLQRVKLVDFSCSENQP